MVTSVIEGQETLLDPAPVVQGRKVRNISLEAGKRVLKSLGTERDQSWTKPMFGAMAQSTSSVCSCTVWVFFTPKSLTAACSD